MDPEEFNAGGGGLEATEIANVPISPSIKETMRLQRHRIAGDQATIAEGAAERDRLRTRISNLESQLQAVADGVDPGFILNQIR
jgi:hypothetical protein